MLYILRTLLNMFDVRCMTSPSVTNLCRLSGSVSRCCGEGLCNHMLAPLRRGFSSCHEQCRTR